MMNACSGRGSARGQSGFAPTAFGQDLATLVIGELAPPAYFRRGPQTPDAQVGLAIELAIRLWALRDAQASRAVRHIDRVRLSYYAKLFGDMGLAQAEARRRAYLLYASLHAQAYIATDEETDVSADLAKMLLGD